MDISFIRTKLEQCKRIRGKLAQYDYRKCSMTFEKFTPILFYYNDLYNEMRRVEIKNYKKSHIHKWLMASKKSNGLYILINS